MNTIYFISGLGADERAFQLLRIDNANKKYIAWRIPEEQESFDQYISALAGQITDPEQSILVGLSFGGIMAVELSRKFKFRKTILISSIKSRDEKPGYLRFFRYFRIYAWVPGRVLNKYNPVIKYAFGIKNEFENSLLRDVIQATDPRLIQWAIDKMVNWNNTVIPANIVHIHGTADRLFPVKNIKNAILVEHGTHFMIANKPDIISSIINAELKQR